ncbi:kinase-like protein [Pseudovirgaria hyperparasitica]|uniref:Kinase-like protein n=1 Tax=Pseudovirgaria hyperparasitica TaxID=470096 RepID=A0A6A6VV19_9PEZI|nr:kinase-like protein [Pseudovirgaria hyperparasitica]KAF2753564.1 kinase-like protein [Pseudovirgaria hyperparasitica]
MTLRTGQTLQGAKGVYKLLHPLKGSTVFKARILSSPSTQAQWAIVKTANTAVEKMCLRREHRNYTVSEIASSPYIRAMYDTIQLNEHGEDPPCLVFEWTDQDLRSIPAPTLRSNLNLPKFVSRAVLSALQAFKTVNAVHTGRSLYVNPNNIYVTGVDSSDPIVKLGDLGNAIRAGVAQQRLQSLPCRAPEIWRGHPCQHSSDVWSVGATLTTKLSGLPLFGAGDKIIEGETEAWCIAKIIRLVGPLGEPIENQAYKDEFEFAKQLAIMDHPHGTMKLITRRHWREELESIPDPPILKELLDFIEFILIVDPIKRPTASEALLHPYLQLVAEV